MFQDRVVAITGAGSGIGRQLALQLAGRGAILALCDLNGALGRQTQDEVLARGGTASHHCVDVADQDAVQAWADAVVSQHGQVDILLNNAGMILPTKPIEDLSPDELRRIVDVNLWGPVYGSLAFLPHLRKRPEASLVTIASIAGEIAFSEQVAYCMSKFAVRGFTEGLRMELLGTSVNVTVVVPGTVLTDIIRNSPGFSSADADAAQTSMARLPLKTQPARAAAQIIRAVEQRQPRVLIGKDAVILDIIVRLFPGQYSRLLRPLAARVSSAARAVPQPKGSGRTAPAGLRGSHHREPKG